MRGPWFQGRGTEVAVVELNQVWDCMNGEGESMLGLRVDFEKQCVSGDNYRVSRVWERSGGSLYR